jgi:hypothetical protein
VNFGRRNINIARYIYSSPDPERAEFIGVVKNNILNKNPIVKGDPWNSLVALSSNNRNDYPPRDRIILPPDEIVIDGKVVGYAFRYQ